ncbi:MAG TPA: DEAD/DEAH box helicase [Planctomycetota bacterium]|nr:DEAD/DEAH box helicase [Planctomycetota bacterium]
MPIGALVTIPELQAEGPARLIRRQSGYLGVRFLGSGAEMTQEERLVARLCLAPRTRVKVKVGEAERDGTIAARSPTRDGALLAYGVLFTDGSQATVREDAIIALPSPRDAIEQLVTASFNDNRPLFAPAGTALAPEPWGPRTFCAREELLAWRDAQWTATGGVIGLAAARVRPLPHQLLTARRALSDRRIRFLLADEVGLGKTIEAGLIVQSLLTARPDLRVLVIVPGALVSQWFLELYVKFGGRSFLMLDGERLRGWTGDPWRDRQLVIASSRAIEEMDGKQSLHLATSKWDVLIVDECHRMQPNGILAKRVAVLSKQTPHVLLLTATPPRSHAAAYLALMALLQPHAYRDDTPETFQARLSAHDAVAALLSRTIAAKAGDKTEAVALAKAWRAAVPGDAVLAAMAVDLAGGDEPARTRLVAYVREHHRLDRRVVRHRRQVLTRLSRDTGVGGLALASRSREIVAYAPNDAEAAMRAALSAYRERLHRAHAPDGIAPPRLAHWLLQLELAAGAHPRVLSRLLAMRAAVLADPAEFAAYRARAIQDETTAQVLRSDLSENEINGHIAVSAACHADAKVEAEVIAALRAAVAAWEGKGTAPTARLKALFARLERFWKEFPQEKVLIFTSHGLAVEPIAKAAGKIFGEEAVETFGAHQDTVAREESARRFQDDDQCCLMVCDPLGGEGRNFQFVSAIAHHDLPWSVAAVEQRIGRVDRLGRDGDVPSWIMAAKDDSAVDAAWGDALDQAVGVFAGSSSGLEFVFDRIEGDAATAALAGGAAAVRALIPALVATVAAERDARDAREDECFHEDAATYAEAAALSDTVAATPPPTGAIARWLSGMGGHAKREEERPNAWRLRGRGSDDPERGVFARDTALAHPQLAFFNLGHGLIDRLVADADAARWCSATAWRRVAKDGVGPWEGVRVVLQFTLDLQPLVAAHLPLDVLRRLHVGAPPRRLLAFARSADGVVESDEAVLAQLRPGFDARNGDTTLVPGANRDAWTRLMLGDVAKLTAWQDGVMRAAAALSAWGDEATAREREAVAGVLEKRYGESVVAARAVAEAAALTLGARHPEAVRLAAEADDEQCQIGALRAAVAGGRLEIFSAAYIALK